jgi:hypothetical protein
LPRLDDKYQNFINTQQEKTGAEMEEVLLQEFKLNNNDIPYQPKPNINNSINNINNNNIENNNMINNTNFNNNGNQKQQFFNQSINNKNTNTQLNPNEITSKINQHQIKFKENAEFIRNTVTESLTMHIKEEEYLQSLLDSDSHLLKSLVEDVEKIERNIAIISNRNKDIKNQIVEYRRKINMEKDNLVKASKKLYDQTNELINSKGNLFILNLY